MTNMKGNELNFYALTWPAIVFLFLTSGCSLPKSVQGDFHCISGEYDQAITAFKEAEKTEQYLLEDDVSAGNFYNNLGLAYTFTDNLDEARKYLVLSATRNPPRAYYPYDGLAFISFLEGNLEEAVTYSKKAYELVHTQEYYNIENSWHSTYSPLTMQRGVIARHDYYKLALSLSNIKKLFEQKKYKKVIEESNSILSKNYLVSFDFGHGGNKVTKVLKGSLADINGIVEGDKVLEVDGKSITDIFDLASATSLVNNLSNLYNKFGQKIPIKVERQNRQIVLECYMYYPELETTRLLRDQSQLALQNGGETLKDVDPPDLVVISPNVHKNKTKSITNKDIEVIILASDNFQVDYVTINGKEMDSVKTNTAERSLLEGNIAKFASKVSLSKGINKFAIKACDSSGNVSGDQITINYDTSSKKEEKQLYGKSIAVVVGINNYIYWPPLEYAVSDALAVKNKLYEIGFDKVIEIKDNEATRIQILQFLSEKLPRILDDNDRLLIYFAGHGQTETFKSKDQNGNPILEKEGYLITVDSDRSNYRGTAISMSKIREISKNYKAKHVLYVFDSCYSGLGLKRSGGLKPIDNYVRKLTSLNAIQVITAGGENEKVGEEMGYGIFTKHFLLSISGLADQDKDGFVTASEIGTYIRPTVSRITNNSQTPMFGWLSGDGDFIFESDTVQ